MARIDIRILHLHSSLHYSAALEPENETESIQVFDLSDLILHEGLEGPRLNRPLPSPAFRGSLSRDETRKAECYTLEAGDYLFSQWRPGDFPSLPDALEELIREAWWEGHALSGPWIVRMVDEDGRRAVQGLRRMKTGI